MAVATFDTLKLANALKAAGVPSEQAEAQTRALAEVVQASFKDLVTKDDLSAGLEGVRQDFKHEIKEVEQRLTAKLDASVAKLDASVAKVDAKLDASVAKVDAKLDAAVIRLDGNITLMRWMLSATFAGVVAVLGILIRSLVYRGIP